MLFKLSAATCALIERLCLYLLKLNERLRDHDTALEHQMVQLANKRESVATRHSDNAKMVDAILFRRP